jgi:hypothetical protein
MNDHKAAAIVDVALELQAEVSWPIRSVIVEYYDLILAELGLEIAEIATGLRRGRHRDSKTAGVFQLLLQYSGGQLPVVIRPSALPVEKQNLYRACLRG